MPRKTEKGKKSIFRAIFIPLIVIMILQAAIFYGAAVYGGIEDSLNQNAADIMSERLSNRKNEIENNFNKDWTVLADCEEKLNQMYGTYRKKLGADPFVGSGKAQIQFLNDSSDQLIKTLRNNKVNGIFLILNDQKEKKDISGTLQDKKNGLCIRDMDVTSVYDKREDLLIERAPSSVISNLKCSLDSWWEANYLFHSSEEGDYFYKPLNAAWDNQDVNSDDLAFFSSAHRIGSSDEEVVSYSIPLMDSDGRPYAVLGVELSTKYLASLMPNEELGNKNKTCYILATHRENTDKYVPITASGVTYTRSFASAKSISQREKASTGGFTVKGRFQKTFYGDCAKVNIYNNNNPFEEQEVCLIALEQYDTLFYYSHRVRIILLWVSVLSLLMGVIGIFFVSHRFALPITSLAKRARNVAPTPEFHLDHIGITEIDQLVDSIESLNQNVSKEVARTEFFSRMSHDMRTPMNAIISFSSEEMLENADESRKDDYLKKIHSSGQYLLGLINEVLDMTKIESNKVDLHYEAVESGEIWKAVIPMVEKLAQKKNIKFVQEIAMETNRFVKVDRQHIDQIVLNLLSNAVKFTPDNGTVLLKVDVQKEEPYQNRILCVITVKDTGIGMSKEFMSKLYHPFEQENSGHGGTGLGLSICKKLVELMGGTIVCHSMKNVGTEFMVHLPMEVCKETDLKKEDKQEKQKQIMDSEAVLKGKHILLCEDHPLNAQIAQKLLERKGITVEVAVNGQIGVDRFNDNSEKTFDAVLMDIRMPVMNGLEAAAAIRKLPKADAKTVPIIALTANAFEEDVRMSEKAGMNAHLSKPIEPDKLYGTLVQLMGKE